MSALYVVKLDPGGGDPILWVEDMITPEFGNALCNSYPQMTKYPKQALQMSRKEAGVVASALSQEGTVSVISREEAVRAEGTEGEVKYIFRTKGHPGANGRKPQSGEQAFKLEFPLQDGIHNVVIECGKEDFDHFAKMIGQMMVDDDCEAKEQNPSG